MGQELGRISGAMLKDNLERLGIDLSVDDDLLYLDVGNNSIGINSTATNDQTALNVSTATESINLIVDTALIMPSITIQTNTNTIAATTGNLNLLSHSSIISPNIQTEDLNINDNVISSISINQTIELRPNASGAVAISSDLNVTGNLHAVGNMFIDGSAFFHLPSLQLQDQIYTFGDLQLDTVQIIAPVDSNIIPSNNDVHSLGENTTVNKKRWKTVHTGFSLIDNNLLLSTIDIKTTQSNSDLELAASSGSLVQFTISNVAFTNDLTVNNIITVHDTNSTGNINHVGNTIQTGDKTVSNRIDLIGNISATDQAVFETITVSAGLISTTSSNADLELRAAGTGIIFVPTSDVIVQNNLSVSGEFLANTLTTAGNITTGDFTNSDIEIFDNIVTTIGLNQDLMLKANATGTVSAISSVRIENNLKINALTTLDDIVVVGNITHTGNADTVGNVVLNGNYNLSQELTATQSAYFNNINVIHNQITTVSSNTDLELQAIGSGRVVINDAFLLSQSLNVIGLLTAAGIDNAGNILSDIFTSGPALIKDNFITTLGHVDLVLASTKRINLPSNSMRIEKDLTVAGLTTLGNTAIDGDLTLTGNRTHTGAVMLTGQLDISSNLISTNSSAFFAEISIINNVISTTSTNTDLDLRAAASGLIFVRNNNVVISNNLHVNETLSTVTINNSQTVFSDTFTNNTIRLFQNIVTTSDGTNLRLTASGLGNVTLPKITFSNNAINATAINDSVVLTVSAGSVDIPITSALKIPVGTTANRTSNAVGDMRLDTTDTLFTGWNNSNVTFGGAFSTNRRTTVLANQTTNTIDFTVNNSLAMIVGSTGLLSNAVSVADNIMFSSNNISANTLDSSIIFTASGDGKLILGNIAISANTVQNINTESNITIENTGFGYVAFSGTYGIAIPVGDELSRPANPELGDFRFNSNLSVAEIFNGIEYESLGGNAGALLTAPEIEEITNLMALVLG